MLSKKRKSKTFLFVCTFRVFDFVFFSLRVLIAYDETLRFVYLCLSAQIMGWDKQRKIQT